MSRFLFITTVILASTILLSVSAATPSNTSEPLPTANGERITVWFICHTHTDPGWLTTYEGYYREKVQRILYSVADHLEKNPDRIFNWVETSFLWLHWQSISDAKKNQLRKLIENGQFNLLHGGWTSNDEASADLPGILTQMQAGHIWLKNTFDKTPKVAWQIDPFGHSSSMPNALAHMGIKFLVGNRIDMRVKRALRDQHLNEFIWQGNKHLGKRAQVFTHLLYNHYSPPDGFNFEKQSELQSYGVQNKMRALQNVAKQYRKASVSKNVLIPMGDDFLYQDAGKFYRSIDLLIKESKNKDYGLDLKYGTPYQYFQAVLKEKPTMRLFTGDWFPYSDNVDAYWSGFYTTSPNIKWLTRSTEHYLRMTDQSAAMTMLRKAGAGSSISHYADEFSKHSFNEIITARQAVGLLQHHDALTGTAKGRARNDYLKRLQDSKKKIMHMAHDGIAALFDIGKGPLEVTDDFPNLTGKDFYPIVLQNSLGWRRREIVTLPNAPCNSELIDEFGRRLSQQITRIESNCRFDFMIEIEPMGYDIVFMRQTTATGTVQQCVTSDPSNYKIDGEDMDVFLNSHGLIEKLVDKTSGKELEIKQTFKQYATSRSGAYIFRANGDPELHPALRTENHCIASGHLMTIVRTVREKVTTEVYIPKFGYSIRYDTWVQAGGNREVVSFFSTSVDSINSLWTDNGIELIKRPGMSNTPIPSQFFPMTKQAAIVDKQKGILLLSQQGLGVANRHSGELEVMIHRNLQQDDGRGLAEPHRDTSTVRVPLTIVAMFEPGSPKFDHLFSPHQAPTTHLDMRFALAFEHPIRGLFSHQSFPSIADFEAKHPIGFAPFDAHTLPSSLHILQFELIEGNSLDLAVVLQNIDFEGDTTIKININDLVKPLGSIKKIQETTLNFITDPFDLPEIPTPVGQLMPIQGVTCTSARGGNGKCQNSKIRVDNKAKSPTTPSIEPLDRQGDFQIFSGDMRAFILELEPNGQPVDPEHYNPDTHPTPVTPEPTPETPETPESPSEPVSPPEPISPTDPATPSETQTKDGRTVSTDVILPHHPAAIIAMEADYTQASYRFDLFTAALLSLGSLTVLVVTFSLFRQHGRRNRGPLRFPAEN